MFSDPDSFSKWNNVVCSVITSKTEWTVSPVNPDMSFRIWENVIYRKDTNLGGYKILYLPLAGRGLVVAQEWINEHFLARL